MLTNKISLDEKYLLMLIEKGQYLSVIEYYRYILGRYDDVINALIEENKQLNLIIKEFL